MAPIDVTGASGQKPSRSVRSQGGDFKRQEARVDPVDFARQTLVRKPATGTAMGALAESFGSFFESQVDPQLKREADELRRNELQEAMRIEALVNADRQGAREAMESGDASQFISPDLQNNRNVADAFARITAGTMAVDDARAIEEQINAMGPTEDPDQLIQDHLKASTKGGDPSFQQAYTRSFIKSTHKAVTNLRKSRKIVQQAKAVEKVIATMDDEWARGDVPVTEEGLKAQRARMALALPGGFKEARAITVQNAQDTAIISAAADGNDAALRAMRTPEVGRSGTSVESRNKGAYEKARAANMKKFRQDLGTEALERFDQIENDLADYTATGKGNIAKIYSDMQRAGEDFHKHGAWRGLRDKVGRALKGSAVMTSNYNKMAIGLTGGAGVGKADWAALAPGLLDEATQAAAAKATGVKPEIVKARFERMYNIGGPGKKQKEANSRLLMTSSNPAEINDLLTRLGQAYDTRSFPMDSKDTGHVSQETWPMALTMLNIQRSGGNMIAWREAFFEAQSKNNGEALKIKGHYSRRRSGDEDDPTRGADAYAKAGAAAWEKLKGQIGSGQSFTEIPQEIRDRILRGVDVGSAMATGQNDQSDDAIADFVGKHQEKAFVVTRDAFGNEKVALNWMPENVVHPVTGKIVPAQQITPRIMEQIGKDITAGKNQEMSTHLFQSNTFGVEPDSQTRTDGTLAVHMQVGLNTAPAFFVGGRGHSAPLVDGKIPSYMSGNKFFALGVTEGDTIKYTTPGRPKAGEPKSHQLSDQVVATWDEPRNGWALRYSYAYKHSTTLKAESDANLAAGEAAYDKPYQEQIDKQGSIARGLGGRLSDVNEARGVTDDETKAPFGAPPAPEEHNTPHTEEDVAEVRKSVSFVKAMMVSAGLVHPVADAEATAAIASVTEEGPTVNEALEDPITRSKSIGHPPDDPKEGFAGTQAARTANFIGRHEDYVPQVYNDRKGKSSVWKPGDRGIPTVGYGYNMLRKDAPAMLKTMGLSYADVLSGKVHLSEPQAADLRDKVIALDKKAILKKFRGTDLSGHQMMALQSLVYNGGMGIVGPRITAAIEEGRWLDAGFEIAWKSQHTSDPKLEAGIHNRRIKEATVFLGPEMASAALYLQPGFTL